MDRKLIFDAVRAMLKRGFTQAEVKSLDAAIDRAEGKLKKKVLKDPATFFSRVRQVTGPLNQIQVDSIQRILATGAYWPLSHVAYALATAWHEARFEPQPEWGKGKGKRYALPGKYGQPQYGRGLVQLTWDDNYEWADDALNLGGALLRNFDLALRPDIAVDILMLGMAQGAFCKGHSLSHHLPTEVGSLGQFINARRIVNGTDKAALIADLAMMFQAAMQAGVWDETL